MKNPQNMAIAVLLITAVVLGALVIANFAVPQPAQAASSVKGAEWIMLTAVFGNYDLLYIVDINARKMRNYYLNDQSRTIDPVDGIDLNQAFAQLP